MTKVYDNGNVRLVVIEPEDDAKCEMCGKVDELRPYGPNFEKICFDCGMKDPETTKKMMNIVLFGEYTDE